MRKSLSPSMRQPRMPSVKNHMQMLNRLFTKTHGKTVSKPHKVVRFKMPRGLIGN